MTIGRDPHLDNVKTVRKFGTLNSKQSGLFRQHPKPQESEKEEVKRLEEQVVVDDSKKTCPPDTSLMLIGAHRDCGSMHRFKSNRNLEWKRELETKFQP